MAKRIFDLVPPYTWDDQYGLELYEVYHNHFSGLFTLFTRGITGLCTDSKEPLKMEELAEIVQTPVSLPDEHHNQEIPGISDGSRLQCRCQGSKSMRGRRIILRGVLSSVIEDETEEGTGELAVAVCNTLAMNNFIPFNSKMPCFALLDVSMQLVGGDFLIEVVLMVKKRAGGADLFPFPVSPDGKIDLESLAEFAKRK